ncbi:MAG TPA: hypothetical protein VGJ05_22260 [Fimbriiglobus sp.]|jgi:hypothetical protein
MRDYDEDEFENRRGSPYPVIVRIAAVLWIGFGALGLIGGMIQLGQAGAQRGNGQSTGGPCCGFVIAIAFIVVGYQTLTGKAKDTLGNGIGSILIGLLYLAIAGVLFAAVRVRAQFGGEVNFIAVFVGLIGISLILAGMLAIVGRENYKAWRIESGIAKPRRRRRTRVEDDDRPRRRRRDDVDDYDDRPRRRRPSDDDEEGDDDRPRRRRPEDD